MNPKLYNFYRLTQVCMNQTHCSTLLLFQFSVEFHSVITKLRKSKQHQGIKEIYMSLYNEIKLKVLFVLHTKTYIQVIQFRIQ